MLVAENEKDKVSISVCDLLFIESADNYSLVCFRTVGKIDKVMLRSSLTRLESQLRMQSIQQVKRCHRSYLVNLSQVQNMSGNAQGYRLHFTDIKTPVLVSRGYATDVLRYFETSIQTNGNLKRKCV
jgi:DNA-binding LytR/AlgR family response regulator